MSTDLDRDERNARSHILECQVEAPLCQRADLPDLGVKPKDAVAEIRLCEALVRRDGVHLHVAPLQLLLLLLQLLRLRHAHRAAFEADSGKGFNFEATFD